MIKFVAVVAVAVVVTLAAVRRFRAEPLAPLPNIDWEGW